MHWHGVIVTGCSYGLFFDINEPYARQVRLYECTQLDFNYLAFLALITHPNQFFSP